MNEDVDKSNDNIKDISKDRFKDKSKDRSKDKSQPIKNYRDIILGIGMDKLIIIAICGVVLVILSIPVKKKTTGTGTSEKATVITSVTHQSNYRKSIENDLITLLSNINGVGISKVMITLKDDGEKIALKEENNSGSSEKNTDSSGGTSDKSNYENNEAVVFEENSSGSSPYIIQNRYPRVEGVAIVCEGGDNPEIVMKITSMVEALFGIDAHKISVIGIKS